MHTFNLLRLTIVICIYSMLKHVVINGNENQPPNLYGLRSTFPFPEKIIGREGGIGSDVGLDGTGGNVKDNKSPGLFKQIAILLLDKLKQKLGGNSTPVGREGGIGSDVGLDGTGGNLGDIGRSGIIGELATLISTAMQKKLKGSSKTVAVGREGGIGSGVGLDGTGGNVGDTERTGFFDIAKFVLEILGGIFLPVGRDGEISSNVGLDGTGGNVGDIGRDGIFEDIGKILLHGIPTTVGRDGGIGSDVKLDGTGGNVKDNGHDGLWATVGNAAKAVLVAVAKKIAESIKG